jgi:arylsulfatase A-like enzyme
MKQINKILALGILPMAINGCFTETSEKSSEVLIKNNKNDKTNILVILADDMGFSDLRCYGSEINTPHIDQLAENGIRFTQFYNSSRCCPSRASLLTGLYSHNTGMGWMTAADLGEEGYTGGINNRCVTIPQLLKKAGYQNYMAGKWHVTYEKYTGEDGPKHNWPIQRGFDKFFGTLKGGGDYFDPPSLTIDNQHIESPENFYYTDAVSDTTVQYIKKHKTENPVLPFFMYVAYTAPHWPLHAKPEDIKKYQGTYMEGWDKLREKRFKNMIKQGILDSTTVLPQRDPAVQSWDSYSDEDKKWWDMRMAIYAAQIDCMDQGIGRIIETLKNTGQFENTLIVFLSDNGACDEAVPDLAKSKEWEDMGTQKSFETYRKPWAHFSNTPFRFYKKTEYEGGIRTPLIISWPDKIEKPDIIHQVGHINDFMPTFFELAELEYPQTFNGNPIYPIKGKSLLPAIEGEIFEREPLYWEHEACRAVRIGDWKLVALAGEAPDYEGEWELYNLAEDPTEINNLVKKYPEKAEELKQYWNKWAKNNHVFPLNGMTWHERLNNNEIK